MGKRTPTGQAGGLQSTGDMKQPSMAVMTSDDAAPEDQGFEALIARYIGRYLKSFDLFHLVLVYDQCVCSGTSLMMPAMTTSSKPCPSGTERTAVCTGSLVNLLKKLTLYKVRVYN